MYTYTRWVRQQCDPFLPTFPGLRGTPSRMGSSHPSTRALCTHGIQILAQNQPRYMTNGRSKNYSQKCNHQLSHSYICGIDVYAPYSAYALVDLYNHYEFYLISFIQIVSSAKLPKTADREFHACRWSPHQKYIESCATVDGSEVVSHFVLSHAICPFARAFFSGTVFATANDTSIRLWDLRSMQWVLFSLLLFHSFFLLACTSPS